MVKKTCGLFEDFPYRYAVSRFTRTYLQSLADAGISKTAAGELSGLKQSVISRLLANERPVYGDHMRAMLRALPLPLQEQCLRAWLVDQCPDDLGARLVLHFGDPTIHAMPIRDDLGQALAVLEDHAASQKNDDLKQVLMYLAKMVGTSGIHSVEEPGGYLSQTGSETTPSTVSVSKRAGRALGAKTLRKLHADAHHHLNPPSSLAQ